MAQPTWIDYNLNGRYQIKELLGQGGMSSVYRAVDPKLRRDVAVKIIHPHLSENPKFVRRFEEEAAAVAQLRHPNIRQVFDSNHDGETYYMVLEFLPGKTLKEQLDHFTQKGQHVPMSEVISTIRQICSAVAYAHKNGVIHRDIKPSNVVISPQGEAILTDFGIAKMVGKEQFTATGAVIGTAAYISPEQIEGKQVDHRTDIYAIGVMLFEMVSGKTPFIAESIMTLMMKHVNDPLPDLHKLQPGLDLKLVSIIEKSLAKNPEDRYQNANEIASELLTVPLSDPPDIRETLIESPRPEAADDQTFIEETNMDQTLPDTHPPGSNEFSQTLLLPIPDEKETNKTKKRGIPRRIVELVSAAIGGGTVVVLALICLIAGAILILPRIFTPEQPIVIPTIFLQSPDNTPVPAPALSFADINGNPVSLSDDLGEWVLVNNWVVDCLDCQTNISDLENYYQAHKDKNFSVLGINAGDSLTKVNDFVENNNITYPIWLDPDLLAMQATGDKKLPNSYLVNPHGNLQILFNGVATQEILEEYITPLLKETSP